jgi:hypothetical protein
MRRISAIIIASLAANVAQAETFNYSCQVCMFPTGNENCDAEGKTSPLRIDDGKMILLWKGKTYRLAMATADDENGCAKYGWHAEGNGVSFKFCTATQGYGAIEDKGGVRVQCNLKR